MSSEKVNINIVNTIPTRCEVHGVIYFLQAQGHSTVEIHHYLCYVHDDNVKSYSSVMNWCNKLRDECIDVQDGGGMSLNCV